MKHKHHIIPKHMGGTDDPSNLVELTVEEHAEAHRRLYEKHGRWQDKLAYQALSGMLGQEEIMKRAMSPWKDMKLTEEHKSNISKSMTGRSQPDSQKQKVADKLSQEYIVTDPQGNTFKIKNMHQFARDNNLDQGNLSKVSKGILRQHKGYMIIPK